MSLLTDPRLFNYVLMGLYACAAVRWALHENWWQTQYWLAALWINLAVTGAAR